MKYINMYLKNTGNICIYMSLRDWEINYGTSIQWSESESEIEVAQSCPRLFATPWTVAYQALPSMGFSRQECWSGLPFPSPGDLPDPGIKPGSPTLQADALPSEPPGKPQWSIMWILKDDMGLPW